VNPALRAQQRYREEAILSASPQRLVTMLYDRLLLDIERAEAAQLREDWMTANTELQHAQQIIAELSSSLSGEWEGSASLRALYGYLTRTLIGANVGRDPQRTRECRELLTPLRDAWHEVAEALAPA
jgi:flagellar protein FliS